VDVYEIDISKKYILQLGLVPRSEGERVRKLVQEWLGNDSPILLLSGDIKLIKVETEPVE